jgi:hypothetical protein
VYEHSFVHQLADFIKRLETGEPSAPTLKDAVVIESAASKNWKDITTF